MADTGALGGLCIGDNAPELRHLQVVTHEPCDRIGRVAHGLAWTSKANVGAKAGHVMGKSDRHSMLAAWAAQWDNVAPLLDIERQSRLALVETSTAVSQLGMAQTLAQLEAVARPWSGLVEMQALLHERMRR